MEEIFITNETQPQFAAHKNYIFGVDALCYRIFELPLSDMCAYSRDTISCHETEYLINYSDFFFCNFNNEYFTAAFLAITILCLIYLIVIVVVSHTCLAPNILAISEYLKLTEHGAAILVNVLATCIPALINTFHRYDNDTELLLNEKQSATLFLRCFVAGVLIIIQPIFLHPLFFLHDQFFYFLSCLLHVYIILHDEPSLLSGILSIVVYFCQYAVTLYSEISSKRKQLEFVFQTFETRRILYETRKKEQENSDAFPLEGNEPEIKEKYKLWSRIFSRNPKNWRSMKIIKFNQNNADNINKFQKTIPETNLDQFLSSLDPRKQREKVVSNTWQKLIIVIGLPINTLVALLIPVCDYRLPLQGWSKHLNILNLLITPLLFCILYWIPIIISIAICLPISAYALYMYNNSETFTIPKNHIIFAFFGTLHSIFILDIVTSEFMALVTIIGYKFRIDRSGTGIFLSAAGPCSKHLVVNMALASWGFEIMAFVSLTSGPICHLLFSTGIIIVLKDMETNSYSPEMREGVLGINGMIFMIIEFFFSFFIILASRFHLRRSYGYFLVSIYTLYILTVLLCTYHFIHSYSSDHGFYKVLTQTVEWA